MQDMKERLLVCGEFDSVGRKYEQIKPGNSFCIIKGNNLRKSRLQRHRIAV